MSIMGIKNRYKDLFIGLFLIVSSLLVYWQVTNYEFINLDDDLYVFANEHVKQGISKESLIWAFKIPELGDTYWHPLTHISHMLDCQFYGMNAGMHHLTNVLIHIANALLLFFVLKKMTNESWKSGIVAALFALHPMNVDSVAWIAERKNLLSTFFWMLTMAVYFSYVQKQRISWYLLAVFIFILGLLSKPMLVTLPFVLLLMDYWPLYRIRLDASKDNDGSSKRVAELLMEQKEIIKKLILEKIPFLILSLASIYVSSISMRNIAAEVSTGEVPLVLRVENAIFSYLQYLYKMVWPAELTIFYPYPKGMPFWKVLLAVTVLLAITGAAVRHLKRHPYFIVGWLWFLGTLVPVLGIMQGGLWPAIAERWVYVPYIGLFIATVWGAYDLIPNFRYKKIIIAAGTFMLLMSISYKSWSQAHYWKNDFSLFTHCIEVSQDNHVAYCKLGEAYLKKGKTKEALDCFQKTLAIQPGFAYAHLHVGTIMASQGNPDKAEEHYLAAIRSRPVFTEAYSRLGRLLLDEGKTEEALKVFHQALLMNPKSREMSNYGVALIKSGRKEEAFQYLSRIIKKDPGNALAYKNLGILKLVEGKMDEAVEYFSLALKNNPDLSEAHRNLAAIYSQRGDMQNAEVHLLHVARIEPGSENAQYNLGVFYLQQGEKERSRERFDKALKINPYSAESHYAYGLYSNSVEHLDEAIYHFQQAIRLKAGYKEAEKKLADVEIAKKTIDKSISRAEKELQKEPNDIDLLHKLAVLHKMKGDFTNTMGYLQKMVEIAGENPEILYNIACVYAKEGRTDDALGYLTRAVQKGFDKWDLIKADADLDSIRDAEGYKKITEGR